MACCGQRRAEAVQQNTMPKHDPASSEIVHTPAPWAKVRFTQKAAILVRGPVTGRHYQFHEGAYSQQVDARDAAVLIDSGYFLPD
jgi:hypothetical protein